MLSSAEAWPDPKWCRKHRKCIVSNRIMLYLCILKIVDTHIKITWDVEKPTIVISEVYGILPKFWVIRSPSWKGMIITQEERAMVQILHFLPPFIAHIQFEHGKCPCSHIWDIPTCSVIKISCDHINFPSWLHKIFGFVLYLIYVLQCWCCCKTYCLQLWATNITNPYFPWQINSQEATIEVDYVINWPDSDSNRVQVWWPGFVNANLP